MARQQSSGSSSGIDELDRAGARSIDVAFAEAANLDQRAIAAQREARMAESQALNDEVQRWNFEKTKALDSNAAKMKIETDKQAIAANEELFKINTADADADMKLADWGAKYFRVLDEKTGDPRLIRQFQINQGRVNQRQILALHAAETKTAAEARAAERTAAADAKSLEARALSEERKLNAEAARKEIETKGLKQTGATVGDDGKLRTTYAAPGESKNPEDKIDAQQKAMTSGALTFGHLNSKGEIEPDKAGGKATHVSAFYPNPTTGKMDRTPPMTIAEFQAFEKAVKENGAQPAKTTSTAAPTAAVDLRIALAKEALADPTASEAHKAAAKKLLGQ